ncbi:MAG: hypothetical protein V1738_04325 [Patescibacteria group bacterium]
MKTFFKLLQYLLMFFGVLFIGEMIFIGWLWFADPFGIKAVLSGNVDTAVSDSAESSVSGTTPMPVVSAPTTDKHPLLSPEQEALAESLGIDPASLPAEITPEMETCLKAAVGEQRAAEIYAGATPTPFEIILARNCL